MLERRVALVVVRSIAILVAALLLTWLALPSPIGSLPWIPSPQPALDGPYRQNVALADAKILHNGKVEGPEDIAFDKDGKAWSGLRDGRIVRFDDDEHVVDVVDTGGRPLGLQFGPDGFLYVADNFSNRIYRVDSTGNSQLWATGVSTPKAIRLSTSLVTPLMLTVSLPSGRGTPPKVCRSLLSSVNPPVGNAPPTVVSGLRCSEPTTM